METIAVRTNPSYDVLVGHGLLKRAGEWVAALVKGRQAMIVADSHVMPLYGAVLTASLEAAGFTVHHYTFPAGEASKNPQTLLSLIDALATANLTRADVLLSLGGGVTGDLGGLAASLYLRGIPSVQIPTSLLAMVDSSVGGKTAVNLTAGKNLLGTFYQPRLVLCDPDCLATLPKDEMANGWAEIIKYAFIERDPLLALLTAEVTPASLVRIIATCVRIKESIVARDEHDHGDRALLNLGHTMGHAIEKLSDFQIPHGRAVGMGMALMTRALLAEGRTTAETLTTLLTLLKKFQLSDVVPFEVADLVEAATHDKKSTGKDITVILPLAVGETVLERVSFERLRDMMTAGMALQKGHLPRPLSALSAEALLPRIEKKVPAFWVKGPLTGTIKPIVSKSHVHRVLIAAALADEPTTLTCDGTNADIEATMASLTALGAQFLVTPTQIVVTPIQKNGLQRGGVLPCGESGTTMRLLLPVVAALGADASLLGEGRLPERPLSPLYEELLAHGIDLSPLGTVPFSVKGQLLPGHYTIAADVSSQFVSGLLFALSILPGESTLTLTGKIESWPYIQMTLDVLATFGAAIEIDETARVFGIRGKPTLQSPGHLVAEVDWSNAAFWLSAAALSAPLTIEGLTLPSAQGDQRIMHFLEAMGARPEWLTGGRVRFERAALHGTTFDMADNPDLVPVLAVVAGAAQGMTTFTGIRRLRIKESDRVESTMALLASLGILASATEDTLTVKGGLLRAMAPVKSANDHRIVMAGAVASVVTETPVMVEQPSAANKSYPTFFAKWAALGGLVAAAK